jgi:hypothetical protein
VPATFEPIVGRYFDVEVSGSTHRIFVEEAGQGIPLLCLHTAGADSRQYRHLLNDAAITSLPRHRVRHAVSRPVESARPLVAEEYKLTTKDYVEQIRAVWKALDL